MQGYRDAFYPPPASPERQTIRSPTHDADGLSEGDAGGVGDAEIEPGTARRGASDRGSSQPLFDRADDEDDGPDFDELLAMEEMEREQAVEPSDQEVREARLKAVQREGEGDNRIPDGAETSGDDAPPPLDEEDEWEGLYN